MAGFDAATAVRRSAVYVRGVPAPGPLRARLRAGLVTADRVDEHCDVWDSRGHLVATGYQLAAVRLPEGPPPSHPLGRPRGAGGTPRRRPPLFGHGLG